MNTKSESEGGKGSSTKFVMLGKKRIPLVRMRKIKRLHKQVDFFNSSKILEHANFYTRLQSMTKETSSYGTISENFLSHELDHSSKNIIFQGTGSEIFIHILANNLEKLKEYIHRIKNPFDIINMPMQDDLMQNPLQISILSKCSLDVVQVLLDNGADIMQPDMEYRNALNYSLNNDDSSYFDLLIEHVYKYPLPTLCKIVGSKNIEKIFFNKAITADAKVIQKIFSTVDIEGNTLIMQCILKKKVLLLQDVLKKIQSNIPFSIMNNIINYQNPRNGNTALCMIAEQGFSNASKYCALLLLKHSACPEIKNFQGFNVVDYAYKLKNHNYYKFLNDYLSQDTKDV